MNPQNAANTYLQESVENAPPIKVVQMLYQGLLRFLDRAAEHDPRDASSEFNHWLSRADAIACELRLALDKEGAPELSATLEQLYLYVEGEILRAMADREVEPVRNARAVVEKLYEGWKTLGSEAA